MRDKDIILRHLEREIRARKQGEEISEQKILELCTLNARLNKLLDTQKRISKELKQRSTELEKQIEISATERNAKLFLQSILSSSIEYSIIAMDLSGRILIWNQGAQNNYGYTPEEVVGKKNIRIIEPRNEVHGLQHLMKLAYEKGNSDGVLVPVRRNKTRFTASININLHRDENNKPIGYVLISRDISYSKLLKEKLLKTNQELEQFAYIASHDLKAPLRAIEQLSNWIEEDAKDKLDSRGIENLSLLRQRVKRMRNLIEGILEYSRAGRAELDVFLVDTQLILQEIIDSLGVPKKFIISFSKKLPIFHAAKVPLMQVFSNLINNAIKHHDRDKGKVHISWKGEGEFYEFSVKDNGPGIEPAYFEKIFRVFQTLQAKDKFESTGIGLSIVKKIVEQQGGKVIVVSEKGKGATFRFTWPKKPRMTILD